MIQRRITRFICRIGPVVGIGLPVGSILVVSPTYEPPHYKTNKMTCAPSEDSGQPGHPPSQIRVFAARTVGSWGPNVFLCGQRRFWSDWACISTAVMIPYQIAKILHWTKDSTSTVSTYSLILIWTAISWSVPTFQQEKKKKKKKKKKRSWDRCRRVLPILALFLFFRVNVHTNTS